MKKIRINQTYNENCLKTSGISTKDKIAYKHPAIFPEKLVADQIKTWTNEKDLVYDPFMGSGTTAKISGLLNRNWLGSEISKEYFEIANQRIEEHLQKRYSQNVTI